VLDESGHPIVLDPENVERVGIRPTGEIYLGRTRVAALQVVGFADPQQLQKVGRNLFDAGSATPVRAEARVMQGVYETSGVDPVKTMVEMIAVGRAYEMNANLIQMQARILQRAVTDMPRLA
jgi:flagellar basal body rod protein FlgG